MKPSHTVHSPPEGAFGAGLGNQSRARLFCWVRASNKEVPKNGKESKQRNYNTTTNTKNDPDRLEMNKFCPFCRKHTVHTETK